MDLSIFLNRFSKTKEPEPKLFCVYGPEKVDEETGETIQDYEIVKALSEENALYVSKFEHEEGSRVTSGENNCYVIDSKLGDAAEFIPDFMIPYSARQYTFDFLDNQMLFYVCRKYEKDGSWKFIPYEAANKYKVTSNELYLRQNWGKLWNGFFADDKQDKMETISKSLVFAVLGGLILLLLIVVDL